MTVKVTNLTEEHCNNGPCRNKTKIHKINKKKSANQVKWSYQEFSF